MHLAERGELGGRYFWSTAVGRTRDFRATFARLANLPLRTWQVPGAMTRLLAGPVLADHIRADAVLSNIRLRGMGFRFEYPTIEEGIQEVLGALHE
jgi:NAD dependent epimerase/dehydratase family enzyme